MNKHTIFYIIIICNLITVPLIAEEEEGGDKAHFFKRKIIIKSLSTYGGFTVGLMGGAIVGNSIRQNKDSTEITFAKVGVGVLVGGVAGTITGRNIAHRWIEYYYPEENQKRS